MPQKLLWKKRTKIVCTLGPGVNSATMIERLVRAGMNIARLNLSHGTFEEHAAYIRMVKEAAAQLGVTVGICLDLPGPKYRTGKIQNGSVELKKGSEVTLTPRQTVGDEKIIPLNYPSLSKDVRVGCSILLDDGAMQLKVEGIHGKDVIAKVVEGGILTPGRGVVVPGAHISEPFLTARMRENLDFAMQQKPDFIALSFVSVPEDVEGVRKILQCKALDIPLISKIERSEAVKNIDSILAASDGIMVARGDLGVEIPLKDVPMIQKELIRRCNMAGKAVITATQMLESMVNSARPTRAEVTDVANAILDGTDAIMLSAETSIGKHPIQAVEMMFEIAQETERHLHYEELLSQRGQWLQHQTDELISYDACHTALLLKAAAIVAFTQSGSTARRVSKYRPHVPIIAITPIQETVGRLELYWGVHAFQIPNPPSIDELFRIGSTLVKGLGIAELGQTIIVTGGIPLGVTGTTNMLKVQQIQ
jgi:pyruvate kinase